MLAWFFVKNILLVNFITTFYLKKIIPCGIYRAKSFYNDILLEKDFFCGITFHSKKKRFILPYPEAVMEMDKTLYYILGAIITGGAVISFIFCYWMDIKEGKRRKSRSGQ